MAKTINIPASLGAPSVTVWINDKKYVLETGKEITVDDSVAELFSSQKAAPLSDSTFSENYRIKFLKDGNTVKCIQSYEDVFSKAVSGANVVAEYDDGIDTTIMPLVFVASSSGKLTFMCIINNIARYMYYYKNGTCGTEVFNLTVA